MTTDDSITVWLTRLKEGDQVAVEAIWNEYFAKLVRFAAHRMSNLPRRIADEEDVALSAMKSFCRGISEDRFPKLNDRSDLWKLLITITARKVAAQRQRQYAQKRGAGQVRGDSALRAIRGDDETEGLAQVLGREPTPAFAIEMEETCQRLFQCLGEEPLKEVAGFKLEGYTIDEIAKKMNCSQRTVHRKLDRIRRKWSTETLI